MTHSARDKNTFSAISEIESPVLISSNEEGSTIRLPLCFQAALEVTSNTRKDIYGQENGCTIASRDAGFSRRKTDFWCRGRLSQWDHRHHSYAQRHHLDSNAP